MRYALGNDTKQLKTQMQQRDHDRKLYTYGTHDSQVSYLLHAFDLYIDQPSYGSGFVMDLRLVANEPRVYLPYSNVTNNYHIYPLGLDNSARFRNYCSKEYCTLDQFERALEKYTEKSVE